MGDVVPIRPPNPGNGARKAVQRYFDSDAYKVYLFKACADMAKGQPVELSQADHMLAWLWEEGFIVEKMK